MPEHFLKQEEAADVRTVLKKAKEAGAVSGGGIRQYFKTKSQKSHQ